MGGLSGPFNAIVRGSLFGMSKYCALADKSLCAATSRKLFWLLRYVDRVTELLHQKLKQADLLLLKKELMIQKGQDALDEQASLEPKLDLLVQKTKDLQKLVSAVKRHKDGNC